MRKRGLLFRREVDKGAGPASSSQKRKKRRRREEESNGTEDEERHVLTSAAAKQVKANSNASSFATAAAAAAAPTTKMDIKPWGLASPVHKAAASALGCLMSGRGKSLKSLTLFPSTSNSKPSKTSTSSSSSTPGARRATHAVASETLRRLEQLTLALKAPGYGSMIAAEEEGGRKTANGSPSLLSSPLSRATVADRLPRPAALVLAYDLLFGQGLRPVGPSERALLRAEGALRAAVAAAEEGRETERGDDEKKKQTAKTSTAAAASFAPPPPLLQDSYPRSARVNSLKWTPAEALACFRGEEGGERGGGGGAVGAAGVEVDPLVDGVLLLPPGTDLHAHPSVLSGGLVLQSRASCLPAVALSPERGWTVVDAVLFPGNKTTHLAALVGEAGRVLAFDRDPSRLETLRRAAERAGASRIVEARVADFLRLDPRGDEFAAVRAVLLDPSCSGSGTGSADVDASIAAAAAALAGAGAEGDRAGEEEGGGEGEKEREQQKRRKRIENLASFQLSALKHALSFPSARRVAYSTCSVHTEENEGVVAAALAWLNGEGDGDGGEEKKKKKKEEEEKVGFSADADDTAVAASSSALPPPPPRGWRLARALPLWPTRGIPEEGNALSLSPEDAAKVIRAHPATDATDGFFVAVFER